MADAPTGVAARGPVTLDGCALSGHAQAALDLHGRGHSADDIMTARKSPDTLECPPSGRD